MTTRDDLTNYPITPERVPAGGRLHYVLVSCGAAKLPHPAPARGLYTGSLFTAARGWVERQLALGEVDGWRILSARHGIVAPDEIIGPYEATMDTKTVDELRRWVAKVDNAVRTPGHGLGLGNWSQYDGHVTLTILAAGSYADPLVTAWNGLDWDIRTPLAGLGMPARIRALHRNEIET